MAVAMFMLVVMRVTGAGSVKMKTTRAFVSGMLMLVRMPVIVVMREVNVKFHAGDGGFLLARNVEMIAVELEFLQFAFQPVGVHAEVEQRGDEHIAGDAAEEVEVKNFHGQKETFNIQH